MAQPRNNYSLLPCLFATVLEIDVEPSAKTRVAEGGKSRACRIQTKLAYDAENLA